MKVKLRVNGTLREHDVEPRTLLVQYLRETCGLTGTHVGCETTICGACTVLLDGKAVKSCTVSILSLLMKRTRKVSSPRLLALMMVLPASTTLCNCERSEPEVSTASP